MSTEAFVHQLRSKGYSLSVHEGRIRVSPKALLTKEDRMAIQERRTELLKALVEQSLELEKILSAISQKASKLTKNPKLLAAARTLLNDCREISLEGYPDRAKGLAQHLATSIPEYLMGLANNGAAEICAA